MARVKLADWEGLDQSKYLRLRIRAKPADGSTLFNVAERIATLLSPGVGRAKGGGTNTLLLGEPAGDIFELAVPAALTPPRLGVTQLINMLSLPAEYDHAEKIIFENIELPKASLIQYGGPRLGVDGTRTRLGVPEGAAIGVILKPRLMNDMADLLEDVEKIARAGVDFVVDDELLVDPDGAPFVDRVRQVIDLLGAKQPSGGERNAFIANVTARPSLSIELAERAKELGAVGLVTNPIVTGFGALEDLAKHMLGMPIFATNIGAALWAKEPSDGRYAGITESAIAKLTRIAGADAVHCGIVGADWYADKPSKGAVHVVSTPLDSIKPAFRVVAGGLDCVQLLENWPFDGEPVLFEAGNAVFNHPKGPAAGVEALKKTRDFALDAADKEDPEVYAKALLLRAAERDQQLEHVIKQWAPDETVKQRLKTIQAKPKAHDRKRK